MSSSAVLCFMLLCPSEPQNITVKPGQDASLQCRTHTETSIILVKWSRADLRPGYYVFFFRDDRSYENYQLPSYRGRVQLRDPKMEDGDVSVVLKNVSFNDTGTYRCRVVGRLGEEFIRTINLTVTDSEPRAWTTETPRDLQTPEPTDRPDGRPGRTVWIPALVLFLVLVLVAGLGATCFFKKYQKPKLPTFDVTETKPLCV